MKWKTCKLSYMEQTASNYKSDIKNIFAVSRVTNPQSAYVKKIIDNAH
jgi:hypothetical protein